jgi:hypothetical protein
VPAAAVPSLPSLPSFAVPSLSPHGLRPATCSHRKAREQEMTQVPRPSLLGPRDLGHVPRDGCMDARACDVQPPQGRQTERQAKR